MNMDKTTISSPQKSNKNKNTQKIQKYEEDEDVVVESTEMKKNARFYGGMPQNRRKFIYVRSYFRPVKSFPNDWLRRYGDCRFISIGDKILLTDRSREEMVVFLKKNFTLFEGAYQAHMLLSKSQSMKIDHLTEKISSVVEDVSQATLTGTSVLSKIECLTENTNKCIEKVSGVEVEKLNEMLRSVASI